MARRGNLFVVSGPAGVGKGTIVRTLLEQHPDVGVSVSCTTRAPRPGEVDGESYYFVSEERFSELVAENAFYEWAHVHMNRYGTLKSAVAKALDQGRDLILEIDVQGCLQVLEQDRLATGVFICPPSRENLEKRLRDRGTETEEALRVRLGNAAGEVETALHYDYILVNQDWNEVPDALQQSVDALYAIIVAKRHQRAAQEPFVRDLLDSLRA